MRHIYIINGESNGNSVFKAHMKKSFINLLEQKGGDNIDIVNDICLLIFELDVGYADKNIYDFALKALELGIPVFSEYSDRLYSIHEDSFSGKITGPITNGFRPDRSLNTYDWR